MRILNTIITKKQVITILSFVALFLLSFILYRLLPESSIIAQAANYTLNNNCLECHTNTSSKAFLTIKANPSTHPLYTYNKEDLLTYFEAVRINMNYEYRLANNNNTLIKGEQLARRYHCFNCHGIFGQGGVKNPKSLKGYIPGWYGRDFDILTNSGDPAIIREWITTGSSKKMLNEPLIGYIAAHYLQKQEIKMLKLNRASKLEIQQLVNYVISIRAYGDMNRATILQYEKDVTVPENYSQ